MIFTVGPIRCCLQDWKLGTFWNFLEWKLDSFRINECSQKSVEITFQDCTNAEMDIKLQTQFTHSLYKEFRGFFDWTVHLTRDKQLLFSLMRRSKNRIYLQYLVNKNWDTIRIVTDQTDSQGQVAFEYLAQIMPGVCIKHNLLTFHSALVEYKDQAFAICAPSGTGKTTHARLWRDYKNALILNGDRAVMGKEGEQWIAYGTPWSGTSGEQINRHAPLKALVILERSEDNSVEKLEGFRAFTGILPHLIYPAWDKLMSETAIDKLNELLCDIPVYRLFCRPDTEAVDVLYRELYEG